MTAGIITTLLIGAILILLTTFIEENEPRTWVTLIILFFVSMTFVIKETDTEIPKYRINNKVQLPDSTWGNVDSVAYKIEGNWYNQEVLKD